MFQMSNANRKECSNYRHTFYIPTARYACWVLTKYMVGPDKMHGESQDLKIWHFASYMNSQKNTCMCER